MWVCGFSVARILVASSGGSRASVCRQQVEMDDWKHSWRLTLSAVIILSLNKHKYLKQENIEYF